MLPNQKNREIIVSSSLGKDVLLFRSMRGTEGLSSLSEYRLVLLSLQSDLQIDAVLGKIMSISIATGANKKRYFSGVVTSFSLAGRQGRYACYHATLRPWLWFLQRAADCRIFQDQTVIQIMKTVFSSYAIADFDASKLSSDYAVRPYCVQYRESDFNFISRLMEQEGISYFFNSSQERHTMVLADSYAAHQTLADYDSLPFNSVAFEAISSSEAIHTWERMGEIQSGSYSLKAFDFEKPTTSNAGSLLVKSSISRKYDQSNHALFDYADHFLEKERGEHLAKIRLESLHRQTQQVRGTSSVRGIHPGSLFTLRAHPRQDQNQDYLITSAEFELNGDEFSSTADAKPEKPFFCHFKAIPNQMQFRAERQTIKPLVQGPQTAMVVGKAGEEIWTDKYGRIKVQFHWDRQGKDDEASSCWVRVAQSWAGKKWGSLFLPRIGQEVIVSFLDGDPDQPLVTGSVYNAVTMPPYPLPENATRSGVKSDSSKGSGGFNEFRLEDKKGSEQVFIRAEKDHECHVNHDDKTFIGHDRHVIVKGEQRSQIDGALHSKVGGNQNQKTAMAASLEAGTDIQYKAGLNFALDAGKSVHIKAGMDIVIEAGATITLKAAGGSIVIGPSSVWITGTPVFLNSGGSPGNGAGAAPTAPEAPLLADDGKK